jgi:hypothetical protein
MGCGVLQLVGLVVPLLQRYEYAQVVLPGADLDGGAGELGADLIKTTSMKALVRAIDIKGADWRMVGCLLSEVRDAHDWGCRFLGRLWD